MQEAAREPGIDSIAPAHRPDHQMATMPQKFWSVGDCCYRVEQGVEADKRLQKELKEAQHARAAEAARYIRKGSRHRIQGQPRG